MNDSEKYSKQIHRLGRIGIAITLGLLFATPIVIGLRFNMMPSFREFLLGASGILILFIPIGISEVIIYSPLLGSASYLTFITGNVLNLKLPVVANAQDVAEVNKGTEEGDVIATLAVGVSSMLTLIIMVLGVLLLAPIKPVLTAPAVKTATSYIIPALFGALFVGLLKNGKDAVVKNKLFAGAPAFLILLAVNIFILSLSGYEGVVLIVSVPLTILTAYILYKKKIIRVEARVPEEK